MSKKPRSGNPPVERYSETTSLAPLIYEGGGPRSGRRRLSAAAEKASSVTASPCQLPRRGSQGCCAPFLPPAFMRGEGREAAGGVPRRSGKALSVTASPCQLPQRGSRERFAPFLPPRIYEGGGPRSGRGSPPPPRREPSQSRFARQLSRRESQGGSGRSPLNGTMNCPIHPNFINIPTGGNKKWEKT